MSLPEPGQPTSQKEVTTPVVEDAGYFVTPTITSEVAHVVTPTLPTPVVSMPPEVTQVGVGVPIVTGQKATPPIAPEKIVPFTPHFGKLGIGLGGWVRDSRNWKAVQDKRKREREALLKAA